MRPAFIAWVFRGAGFTRQLPNPATPLYSPTHSRHLIYEFTHPGGSLADDHWIACTQYVGLYGSPLLSRSRSYQYLSAELVFLWFSNTIRSPGNVYSCWNQLSLLVTVYYFSIGNIVIDCMNHSCIYAHLLISSFSIHNNALSISFRINSINIITV
jgi:hypothetical protein